MAGKRVLDLAAIFNASCSIGRKHIALRSHQLNVYTKTSTLAKAVKDQTDRVTLTAQAAIILAQRLNDLSPSYSTQASEKKHYDADGGPVPSNESVQGKESGGGADEGLEQDHFYKRSETNTTSDPQPEGDLGVRQEKAERHPSPDGSVPPAHFGEGVPKRDKDIFSERPPYEPIKEPLTQDSKGDELDVTQEKPERHPLPDGTIPPTELDLNTRRVDAVEFSERPKSGPVNEPLPVKARVEEEALQPRSTGESTIPNPTWHAKAPHPQEARELQREAESQIPSHVAEQQSNDNSRSDATKLSKGHDEDVFYTRSAHSSSVLSELPRAKIPKHTKDTQGSDDHVDNRSINSDVYYSFETHQEEQILPRSGAIPEQEQPTEGINTEIFHSPRIAKMLAGKPKNPTKPKELNMKAAQGTPVEHTDLAPGKDQDTFNVRSSAQEAPGSPSPFATGTGEPSSQTASGEEDVHKLATDIANEAETPSSPKDEASADVDPKSTRLPYQMQESRVPSSRFGRLWQYGGLATGMALGAVSESFRRVTSGSDGAGGSLVLSAGNMERLVAKLSRMRGAALKIGQMMSFQDSKMLPAPIHEVLQRVQDNADYMPASQRNKVLASNLGSDWRELFDSFDEMPMAAASIGQVHGAVLKSAGQRVAVKVQYPGVADSIDSDLNNLSVLLTASRLLPKGLYLDKTIANARTELAWECDYIREADCGKRFRNLLQDEKDVFVVPEFIDEACGKQVLTMERMEGVGVTKVQTFTQEQKDWIGTQILRLCLREITEFRFMQSDPNWTNFLFNETTRKLELLDFGASREYPFEFIDPYIRLLLAASQDDKSSCRELSIELGYLTGHESNTMLNAHLTSILTLAEPFRDSSPEVYDFRDQTITDRVKGLIPVMVKERLKPPPEETYSLHRKLSGAFLLCARLGSRVRCREMFRRAMERAGLDV
ncbi:MAG: hypothetical protein M1827_000512 [Pycnora praestabilis]|nr:MAG: hypothetical protein M1827_000512 [Pycnora praestabilis]